MKHIYQQYIEEKENEFSCSRQLADSFAKDFFSYLLRKRTMNIIFLQQTLKMHTNNNDPFAVIRKRLAAKTPSVKNKLYQMLEQYYYLPLTDVLACCSDLARPEEESLTISEWKDTPYIKEIFYQQETEEYMVLSSFGSFSFQSFDERYPEELKVILESTSKEDTNSTQALDYQCHASSLTFLNIHPECSIITAECPHFFRDCSWLHSYILTPDGETVIDPANGFIMRKEMFDLLLEPDVICEVKGTELATELGKLNQDPPATLFLHRHPYLRLVQATHAQKLKESNSQKQLKS